MIFRARVKYDYVNLLLLKSRLARDRADRDQQEAAGSRAIVAEAISVPEHDSQVIKARQANAQGWNAQLSWCLAAMTRTVAAQHWVDTTQNIVKRPVPARVFSVLLHSAAANAAVGTNSPKTRYYFTHSVPLLN
jgi:hypothetical protein